MNKTISGIDVEVTRKHNRRIIIKVKNDGKVCMTVPYGVPFELAEIFFNDKIEFVRAKIDEYSQKFSYNSAFKEGDIIYIFGKEYTLKYAVGKNGVKLTENEIIVFSKVDNREKRIAILQKFFNDILLEKCTYYFDVWYKATGLKASSVRIHKTTSRWGSCNHRTGVINLSLYLVFLPEICLDYVVLHELGHILYNDHGKQFKAFLTRFMPEHSKISAMMSELAKRYVIFF